LYGEQVYLLIERTWLADQGFRGDGEPPVLTEEVRVETAKCYIQAYEIITGEEFVVSDEPINERIGKALASLFGQKTPGFRRHFALASLSWA